jgi:hypothetical protein
LELASDAEDAPWHWRSALAILAKHEIDWSVVGRPANEESGLRLLGLLLYARTEGISVPDAPINRNDPGESSDQVKPSQLRFDLG